jgi:hypothetical protein
MNQKNRDQIPESEISHLAREINRPLRTGFKDRVFEQIRQREKEQERKLDREKTKEKDRDRGIER